MVHRSILALCLCLLSCASVPTTAPATSTTDADLDAAIRQARASLDTFMDRVQTPHANRTFVALKVRFYPPNEVPQDLWVDEVAYTGGVYRGRIGDDIPTLKLEAGEKVRVNEKDILDWMIVENGKLIGGYTIRLAVQRMAPEERERFLETLDYSIED